MIALFLIAGLKGYAQQIEEIEVQNVMKSNPTFLKNLLEVREGQALDSLRIKEDVEQLNRLPGIANATYSLERLEGGDYKLVFDITENFTIIPSANVYTTNNGEFAFRLGLYEFNAFGRNIAFGGFFQRDIYNSYGVRFRAPQLFSRNWGLAVNFQDWTTQEPVFFDIGTAQYKYNNFSIEALGLHTFDPNNRIEFGVNFFKEEYDYKEGAFSELVPLNVQADKWAIKGLYAYNKVESNYQYFEGLKNILNVHYNHSSEDILPSFWIGWNDFIYYKRVGQRGNWANRVRLGLAENSDSPFAPFSVDNNLNIRGVGNTIDRGTGAVVINTEYRHTLLEKSWFVLQGNAFIDAGSWRQPGGELNDFVESENIRVYPGLGVRAIHKKIFNAVFRIDYGYGISKNATHGLVFGIRQYF